MSFDLSVNNLHTESIGTSYYLIGLINRFNLIKQEFPHLQGMNKIK